MTRPPKRSTTRISVTLLTLLLLSTPMRVFAHGGRSNEFQGESHSAQLKMSS